MPNRIIREGWLESDRVDALDAPAERFFLRLCLRADDFGRFHGNPTLLKSSLFPLKDDVRSADIPRWIAACEKAGLIRCYEVASKRYVEVVRFGQRMRAETSKFPSVEDGCLSDVSHVSDGRMASSGSDSKTDSEPKANAETVLPFSTEDFARVWGEWIAFRKRKRKPLSPDSISQTLKDFAIWGELGSIHSMQTSIRNDWQGLFPPKEHQQQEKPKPTHWAEGRNPNFKLTEDIAGD